MKTTLAIGLLLAATRIWIGFHIEPESFHWVQAYKDAAHLFMGGLATAWYLQRNNWQWRLFWGLNLVEVVVAVLSRI